MYVPELSEDIARTNNYFTLEFKIAMTTANKNLNRLTNTKHKLTSEETSGVVYKIVCQQCYWRETAKTWQKYETSSNIISNKADKCIAVLSNTHK